MPCCLRLPLSSLLLLAIQNVILMNLSIYVYITVGLAFAPAAPIEDNFRPLDQFLYEYLTSPLSNRGCCRWVGVVSISSA
ncbi:hypothetical protein BGW36DRAFT_378772 [Talaromyces proteolyticus]|uniref:Uncharacterized protein n=1 Tax=Talaromyces proteolyticus TaxID=1131652 RepID=A0AAD4KR62_9EURO|nr:uncharacterized protein BGW36DRAFT_378772 [Talaromyces proteolyticus]KAH8697474.1 hypothetical protein BGW36DRAFT_378772 [Talaromyces proteolyticus]